MMEENFTVSARKFRPQTFSEIIGQPHIVRTLTNALDRKMIAHAYLFSGTRGVGKTTTARILAKALNCSKGPTSRPCGQCDNCKEITVGSSIDVLEIDGASNRGIDNIRELRESAKFTPISATYKIYIIDEVHQITKDAFNALLKTLEEPPAHVIFIFATTELNKVPDTILSRCQSFEYRPISRLEIAKQLEKIAEVEQVNVERGAIDLLARRARGSMRDAQSLFDQVAAYAGGSITENDVMLTLGMVDNSILFGIIDSAVKMDKPELLKLTGSATGQGSDPLFFIEGLSSIIRNIMVAKVSPSLLTECGEDEKRRLDQWAQTLDYDEIQRFFKVLTETLDRVKRSPQPEIDLEMGLLRLTQNRGLANIDSIIKQVAAVTETIADQKMDEVTTHAEMNGNDFDNLAPAPPEVEQALTGVEPAGLLDQFKNARPLLMGILEGAKLQVNDDTVTITVKSLFDREKLMEAETKKSLETVAERAIGKVVRLLVKYHDEKKKTQDMDKLKIERRKADIRRHIEQTPIIQKALDVFNGEITSVKTEYDN